MTFLAFGAADVFDGDGVFIAPLEVAGEFAVDAIEFVAVYAFGSLGKIDLGGSMAVDAPAHAEIGELPDLVHLLDRAMAGLTLHLAHPDVLGVIEIHVIRQVMYFHPFNWLTRARISLCFGIPSGVFIQLFNLSRTVHLCSIFTV